MSTKRKVLIIGAGRSASSLIKYLSDKSTKENLQIILADIDLEAAQKLAGDLQNIKIEIFDIFEESKRSKLIKDSDLVISMLPARFHMEVAKDCLKYGKHMVTASYISPELKALDDEVKAKGLVWMNEIGLDPGIDHMSAMQVLDRIRDKGGKMLLFESFTGGLVAPESDTNKWNYKFTWNPRNVVVAGQGGVAKFIQEGKYKYIPYQKLFRRSEILKIGEYGNFEAYANRDSLKYREAYGLKNVLTLYRGTIRRIGFSRAWNIFVQLGMTDDSYEMENTEEMSYREFTNSFLPYRPHDTVELKLRNYLHIEQDDILWEKITELELCNPHKKIGLKNATPAQALQKILMDKWMLQPEDKDMIVMLHIFGYELNGEKKQIESHMVVIGDDQKYTAMAKTVGLPVAIVSLKILNKEITTPGVQIPIKKEVYEPILEELSKYGILFKEERTKYLGYNPDLLWG